MFDYFCILLVLLVDLILLRLSPFELLFSGHCLPPTIHLLHAAIVEVSYSLSSAGYRASRLDSSSFFVLRQRFRSDGIEVIGLVRP